MNANSNVQLKIINNRIGGIFNSTDIQLIEVYSKFDNISQSFLNILSKILKPIIKIAGSTFLRFGFQIPFIEGVKLANRNQIIIFNNILRLDTDLLYASSEFEPKSKNRVSRFNYLKKSEKIKNF